jgi:hypothetical protein
MDCRACMSLHAAMANAFSRLHRSIASIYRPSEAHISCSGSIRCRISPARTDQVERRDRIGLGHRAILVWLSMNAVSRFAGKVSSG